MTCPECEKYRRLLAGNLDAQTRAALILDRAAHIRTAHPELAEENRTGLAVGLWPNQKVRVIQEG